MRLAVKYTALAVLFLFLLSKSAHAIDPAQATDFDQALKDLRQKLTILSLGQNAKDKLYEHLEQEPEYVHEYIAEVIEFRYGPKPYLALRRDEDILGDQIRKNVVDSARYGLERSIRDLQFYTLARQWLLGLFSLQLDKPRDQAGILVENPSVNRPLDVFNERHNDIDFACSNLVGNSAETFRKRIECFDADVRIKRDEATIYKFRIRPGFDVRGSINSNLNITPSFEPFVEIKLRKLDAKLSYSVPVTIYHGKVVQTNTLFNDLEDAFVSAPTDNHDRLRLHIERYLVTRHFNLTGNYQFERATGRHFISLSPQYVSYPYRVSMPLLFELQSGRPRLSLSFERAIYGKLVLGITGFGEESLNNGWRGQIGATTQITW